MLVLDMLEQREQQHNAMATPKSAEVSAVNRSFGNDLRRLRFRRKGVEFPKLKYKCGTQPKPHVLQLDCQPVPEGGKPISSIPSSPPQTTESFEVLTAPPPDTFLSEVTTQSSRPKRSDKQDIYYRYVKKVENQEKRIMAEDEITAIGSTETKVPEEVEKVTVYETKKGGVQVDIRVASNCSADKNYFEAVQKSDILRGRLSVEVVLLFASLSNNKVTIPIPRPIGKDGRVCGRWNERTWTYTLTSPDP
eukprot:GHVS01097540.1.p1 GENE.GHVS01097540.1~~GHVS01097540.1.p1  ORF type:complete len:249 (-),score=42.06 GHVS01097540.1:531-1277(-)